MATIQQLIDEANLVVGETREGGNTQTRIGNLYLGILDFIKILDQRTITGMSDDTLLKEAIARIDSVIEDLDQSLDNALLIVNQERDRLNNLVDNLDNDIEEKVDSMIDDAAWLEEHAKGIRDLVNEGEITWKSEWDENVEAYLQEVGIWAREGDVVKTQWTEVKQDVSSIQSTVAEVQIDLSGRPTSTQWSQISQKVNGIEQSVNALLNQGEVTEALQSSITQSIDDKVASLNLETTYAKKDNVDDSNDIIEWMYSAFKNSASPDMSVAQMHAAGKSGINNAVSEVRTYVNAIKDGDFLKYEAETSVETKVNDVITGLYSKATPEAASTSIFSQVKKDSEDISSIVVSCTGDSSSASIATKFGNFVSGLSTKTDTERAITGMASTMRNEITTATAGLVAEATMDAALAAQTAKYDGKLAGFIAKADLDNAIVQMIAEDEDQGTVASIFAYANAAGSGITLSADKVSMTNAFANSITANEAFVDYLEGGNATFKGTIKATSLELGNGVSIGQDKVSGLVNDLASKANTEDIPTAISDLTGADSLITTDDVSVGNIQTDSNGVKSRTITVGDVTYTEIVNDNFVIFGQSKGTDSDGSRYFKIDSDGLLKARNAIVYGTIYATAGEFTGKVTAGSGKIGGFDIGTTTLKSSDNTIVLDSQTGASSVKVVDSNNNYVKMDTNGFEAKWGSEGFKIGASGLQRYDSIRQIWMPMYENKVAKIFNTSSINLRNDETNKGVTYVVNARVSGDDRSTVYLPYSGDVPNGTTITVRGLTYGCNTKVQCYQTQLLKDWILVGDDCTSTRTLDNADCAEFIMCKNVGMTIGGNYIANAWLCNFFEVDI